MPKRSDIQKPKCLHKHIQIATPTHNYILNRDRIIPKDRNQSYLPKPAIIRSSDTETDTIDTLRRTRHLDVTVTTALLRSLPPLSEPPPSYCSRPPVTQSMVASTAGSSLRHGCHLLLFLSLGFPCKWSIYGAGALSTVVVEHAGKAKKTKK